MSKLRGLLSGIARSFPARVVERYSRANGGIWATTVAWNLLFAFFPIALIVLTVTSWIFGSNTTIQDDIATSLPNDQGQMVLDALTKFHHSAGLLVVVSVVGLLWSGSSLFGSIDQSLDALYHTKSRGFVSQKLMSTAMVVVFTVLILVAIGTSSGIAFLDQIGGVPGWISRGPGGLALQALLGVLDGFLLLGVVYFVVPNRRPSPRAVAGGAIVAGVALEALTLLFPLYFRVQHGFSTYGSTFALFFLILTYAYFVAQIIVVGGAVMVEMDPPSRQPASDPVARAEVARAEHSAETQTTAHTSRR